MRAKRVTIEEACELFGRTDRALRSWRSKKCPGFYEDGDAVLVDVDEVLAWLEQTGRKLGKKARLRARAAAQDSGADGEAPPQDQESLAEAKRRKEIALAQKHELDLAIRRGEYLRREEVQAKWLRRVQLCAAGLDALPGRLAGRLVGLSEREVFDVLRAELDELRRRFSGGE